MPGEEAPLGWGYFDINGGGANVGTQTWTTVETSPPAVDIPRVYTLDSPIPGDVGMGGGIWGTPEPSVIPEIPEAIEIPGIPGISGIPGIQGLSEMAGYLVGVVFDWLEWIAMKVPAQLFMREEVDELTMRGASILLFICFLLATLFILVFYVLYKAYKNRTGYNRVLRYVGNQVEIPPSRAAQTEYENDKNNKSVGKTKKKKRS
jgi:hypothetical protein